MRHRIVATAHPQATGRESRRPYGLQRCGRAATGSALIAVLGVLALLLPLGVYAALQARMDLLIERNLAAEVEAFYVAEAGLEHAVAELRPGTSFDPVLAGPDRLRGTADDGVFPFDEGSPTAFPAAPLHYTVHVARRADGGVDVSSTASGRNGAAKVIAAIVKWSPLPFTPAALYLDDDAQLTLGAGLAVSGMDHDLTASPASSAAVPALATSVAGVEPDLRRRLADGAGRLVGAGDAPSIVATPSLDLRGLAAACAQLPDHVTAPPLVSTATFGSIDAPRVTIANDLDVAGDLNGAGILVIRGTLHVSGQLSFAGLIVALGGVVCEPSSGLHVLGALWRSSGSDPRLSLDGQGTIAYSSVTLGAVDGAFPGILPHAAMVAGWQEVL